jgi:DNA-binding NarL/FixJ family response regulator
VRVVVADDAVLLREGLVRILAEDGFDVAAAVGRADDLIAAVEATHPDVAIVDVRMPPTHTDEGIAAARHLRLHHPGVGVLLLSQYVEVANALDLFRSDPAGLGYLLKDRVLEIDDFLDAVRRVARGGSAIDPEIVAHLVGTTTLRDPLDALSPREHAVLTLMAEGLSNIAISTRLFLGVRTIESHVNTVFTKLGLLATPDDHRRVRAVLAYLQAARTPR